MLLKGKPVVDDLFAKTKQRLHDQGKLDGYVAIFLLSDDRGSETYVRLKSEYAKRLWIYADIKFGKDRALDEVIEEIMQCNTDPKCLWIMVQLPLAQHLQKHQQTILESIDPAKDIDGLTSKQFGMHGFGYHQVMWATPQSAFAILDHYELGEIQGKNVFIISQSNLIGKRLSHECMRRGATVLSANHFSSPVKIAEMVNMSELIFSATWVKHLINGDSMKEQWSWNNKVFIDIWRWSDSDGAYGDMAWKFLEDKVKAITPVPGGVGPVTVACLFWNITQIIR